MPHARSLALVALALAIAPLLPSQSAPADADRAAAEIAERARRRVRVTRESPLAVLARVATVHPSPGIWCGVAVVRQEVTWDVLEVLAGSTAERSLTIGHLLVANSALVADEPYLRRDLIRPGARAILYLEPAGGGFRPADEDYGVEVLDPPIAIDADLAACCQLLLDSAEFQKFLHPEMPGRTPLVVRLNGIVPRPLPVACQGRALRFLPEELARGLPFVEFDRHERMKNGLSLRLSFPAEGLIVDGRFHERDGIWKVHEIRAVER